VSLGHNGRIAVGLTVHTLDQEDLYVYETRPGDPSSYRYGTGWEPLRTVEEEIPVKGAAARRIQLRFTRHGPVLHEDPGTRRAYALRAAWLEPGMVPYLRSLAYMQARDWRGFLKALEGHGLPGLNYLYADRRGTIGLAPSGFVPRRPNWDGLLPVPGDGRYEWNGLMNGTSLPRWSNPPEGWLASANEMNLPKDFPHGERRTGFEWADRFRADRLRQFLGRPGPFTVEDLRALQCDTLSLPALRLMRLLEPPVGKDPAPVASALRLLLAWDAKVDADSAAAALFEVWFHRHLRPAVVAALLPRPARSYAGDGDMTRVLEALERPDARLGGDRRKLLRETLGAAWEDVRARLGGDHTQWKWGNLLQARFTHALSARATASERAKLDAGPARRGGSRETVGRSGFRGGDLRLELGASVKLILDTGDWDRSLATNAPGQSGDPDDPHYKDLLDDWAADRYFPLLHSRKAILKATTRIINLEPAGKAR
jgi:penicillin amidase